MKAIRVIITGATGMVGEGVLHECLNHPQVETVLVINRKASGIVHPKVTEILHEDFFDLSTNEKHLSGAGTDSSEKGSSMWARVKGKTENDLMKLPFKKVFAFRPGFIKPIKGLSRTHNYYKYITWLFPLGRAIYQNGFCTLKELALAMIHVVNGNYDKKIITGKDIIILSTDR